MYEKRYVAKWSPINYNVWAKIIVHIIFDVGVLLMEDLCDIKPRAVQLWHIRTWVRMYHITIREQWQFL